MSKETPLDNDDSMLKAKNTAIFAAWIFTLLIVAGALWFLTQPLRTRILANAVNRVLEQSGDPRRLDELSAYDASGFFGTGVWFTLAETQTEEAWVDEGTRVVIFSFLGEGTFFPCAAVVNPEGRVVEFIPLNNHGKRIIRRISPEILEIHARRIEGNRL